MDVSATEWSLVGPAPDPSRQPVTGPPATPATFCAVVVVHNMAQFLPEALESVFAQTRPADQVVVCDDASEDDLDDALAPYADRVELIRRRSRGGEGAARNDALARTTCAYTVTLDGDDSWHTQRLEAFAWAARVRPDFDIITSDLLEFGPQAQATPPAAEQFPITAQRDLILDRNFLPAPAIKVAALRAVGGFDESLTYGPDWEAYARMIVRGSAAALVPERLYHYRRWRGQQSADTRRVLEGNVAVVSRMARYPELSRHDHAEVAMRLSRARIDLWLHCLVQGEPVRRSALQIAGAPLTPVRTRALAAIGAVSPRLAAAVFEARHGVRPESSGTGQEPAPSRPHAPPNP